MLRKRLKWEKKVIINKLIITKEPNLEPTTIILSERKKSHCLCSISTKWWWDHFFSPKSYYYLSPVSQNLIYNKFKLLPGVHLFRPTNNFLYRWLGYLFEGLETVSKTGDFWQFDNTDLALWEKKPGHTDPVRLVRLTARLAANVSWLGTQMYRLLNYLDTQLGSFRNQDLFSPCRSDVTLWAFSPNKNNVQKWESRFTSRLHTTKNKCYVKNASNKSYWALNFFQKSQ